MKKSLALALLGLLAACVHAAETQNINGAGSSAAAPIYRSWSAEYLKQSGVELTYDSIGSSAGLKKIRGGDTGFGASDVAPTTTDLQKDGLLVFPIAITGISPVVNLPKVGDGQLVLSGSVLGRIFMGDITRWNDAAIALLNPELALPDVLIKVVVRSDGSGTTYNFSDYLTKASPAWKAKHGVKSAFTWPASFIAAKGSEGVVNAVKETSGAIGYVDFGYVKDNHLRAVQLKTMQGDNVPPSIEAFNAALSSSDWIKSGSFSTTLTNMPGKGAWPITMGTFALVPQVTQKPEQTQRALQFFIWAFMNGDALVRQSNFVRLPDRIQALAFKAIASVKDASGKSLRLTLNAPRSTLP
jgi:phosphate transport system substrate-binding protein